MVDETAKLVERYFHTMRARKRCAEHERGAEVVAKAILERLQREQEGR